MTHAWLNPEAVVFLQKTVTERRRFRKRYATYHRDTIEFFKRRIPPYSRVLLVGCDIQELAEALGPIRRTVVDWDDPAAVDLSEAARQGPYDYVVLPFTLHFLQDIQSFFDALRPCLSAQSRLIMLQYSFFWAPLIKGVQKIGLRSPLPDLNWLSRQDVRNLLSLSHYQEIITQPWMLVPFHIPLLTRWANRYVAPFLPFLCQKMFSIARPLPTLSETTTQPSVTIVIPARNEAGNIKSLLDRLPVLSPRCEVIFVEGHSQDQTWEEIQRQMTDHPRRHEFTLQAFQQQASGKADAVRLGFSRASGDILIILDADLSVPPEDLAHFYDVVRQGSAEFANGSRLVYRMEKYAMQILNLFFNKLFGLWISALIGQPVKDTLCRTKALRRENYQRIRARFAENDAADPFGDFELLFGAAWLNLKICDIPVRYKERTYGQTNIQRFRNGWQLLKFCMLSWTWMR